MSAIETKKEPYLMSAIETKKEPYLMSNELLHKTAKRARDILSREGWIQGAQSTEDGWCWMGALHRALLAELYTGLHYPLILLSPNSGMHEFAQALNFTGPEAVTKAVNWNDTPGRTKEQVLARLDKLIAETAPEPVLPPMVIPPITVGPPWEDAPKEERELVCA